MTDTVQQVRRLTIGQSVSYDGLDIVKDLRPADLAEIQAVRGTRVQVGDVLMAGILESVEAYTIRDDENEIVAILGVQPNESCPLLGQVWMVGTNRIETNRIEFLRHSSEVLDLLTARWPMLWNRVDARNTLHIRWLKWMGFQLRNKVIWGKQKLPFWEFYYVRPASGSGSGRVCGLNGCRTRK